MNVVSANENRSIIDNLDIDIIKRVDGVYEIHDLLSNFNNLYFNKLIIDITSIKNYTDESVIFEFSKLIDQNRVILLLNDSSYINSVEYFTILIKNGFYNFTRNKEGIKYLYNNANTFDDVKHLLSGGNNIDNNLDISSKKIIGISNVTNHAGSTSLTNMLVRQLNSKSIKTIGIEMNRQDMMFYRSEWLFSCMNKNDFDMILKKNNEAEVVFIDLNESKEASNYCDEILYLVEPSYIKLTKLMRKNQNAFAELDGEKVILNMSFVGENELVDFQNETKCKVFFNLPPMNDRNQNIDKINELLAKLGF